MTTVQTTAQWWSGWIEAATTTASVVAATTLLLLILAFLWDSVLPTYGWFRHFRTWLFRLHPTVGHVVGVALPLGWRYGKVRAVYRKRKEVLVSFEEVAGHHADGTPITYEQTDWYRVRDLMWAPLWQLPLHDSQ